MIGLASCLQIAFRGIICLRTGPIERRLPMIGSFGTDRSRNLANDAEIEKVPQIDRGLQPYRSGHDAADPAVSISGADLSRAAAIELA